MSEKTNTFNKKLDKIKFFLQDISLILILFIGNLQGNIINIKIPEGYKDSCFTMTDIGYNGRSDSDTIQFSNGLLICEFYTQCDICLHVQASGGIYFINQDAITFKSKDANDVIWENSLVVPSDIYYADSTTNGESLFYPSYELYHVSGPDVPQFPTDVTEMLVTPNQILYCQFNNRYFKFQLDSVILDTLIWEMLHSMVIKFSCDSLGNGRFQSTASIFKEIIMKRKNDFQFRFYKDLGNLGLFIGNNELIYVNLSGRKLNKLNQKNQFNRSFNTNKSQLREIQKK